MKITVKNISLLLLIALSFTWFFGWSKGLFFYQENSTLFIYSADYLRKFTDCPGGLLVWAGNFLAQGYFSPLYGSVLLSLLIVTAALIYYSIINRLEGKSAMKIALSLLPAGVLLLFHSQYEYNLYDTLGFLISAGCFLLSVRAGSNRKIFIFLIIFPALYYITGSFSIVYAGAFIIWNLFYGPDRKYTLPVFCLAYCFLIFLLFRELVFFQPDKKLLGYPLIFNENRIISSLKIIFALLIVMYPALIKLTGLIRIRSEKMNYAGLSLFPIIAAALIFQYNPSVSGVMKLEKMVHEQDWNSVIREYERSSQHNIVSQYFYDLALAETGQLCNRMFCGDQSSGPLALSLAGNRSQSYRTIYFYYSIGLINEAHHLAYESMVRHGYTPGNLMMLVKTELLRGNYLLARKYLDKMEKTLHYRTWAEKYLRMAADTSLIRRDTELSSKLKLMPAEDFFIGSGDPRNIESLLRSNPQNRTAFEYKLAWSLLEKDIIAVSNDALKIKDFGYTSIPRHVEEAIVAYRNVSDEAPGNSIIKINPETEKRFFIYGKMLSQYKGDKKALMEKIGKAEKNTFWYYMQFSTIKSDFLKSMPTEKNIN